MTSRQLIFCENMVGGMSQTAAYRLAYPSCRSNGAARTSASKLLTNHNISEKIEELQNRTQSRKTLSWQRKREVLAKIVEDPNSTPMEVLAAIKVDNIMSGHNNPPANEEDSKLSLVEIIRGLTRTTGLPCDASIS